MATEPKPKTNRIELKVSEACYNEIAAAMNASGVKLEVGTEIVLNKDVMIKNPLDLRLIGMRKDAAEIAAKVYSGNEADFIKFADQVANFIVYGNGKPEVKPENKGWGK